MSKFFCNGLILVLIFTTALLILLLIGGILAWLDIRKEESELINLVFKKQKDDVKILDVLRWHESYVTLSFIVITSTIAISYFEFYTVFF